MTVVQEIWRRGGTATTEELVGCVGRRALAAAVREGAIVRRRRGLYCLPDRMDQNKAQIVGGVVSHLSAAEYWDLGALVPSRRLHMTVARHRSRVAASGVKAHYADLAASEFHRGLTTVVRTVIDCARTCSTPQALAIADTALRTGLATRRELLDAAARLRGPGSARARFIARQADPRSQSPLESALRGLLLDAGITWFDLQRRVRVDGRWIATVDLCDPVARIVLEADSFLWHGQRDALERDCRRYNDLVVAGYLVLRFAWEHVLGDPEWVVATVRTALARHRAGR
ncbi:MAG: DUF559 domain-containing protein [Jiangellaceae bacterium]